MTVCNSYTVLIDPAARTSAPRSHPQIRWSLVDAGNVAQNWLVTVDATVAHLFEQTMRELEAGGLILDWYQVRR